MYVAQSSFTDDSFVRGIFTEEMVVALQVISGERLDVHMVVDDPAGNSYIQVCSPTASVVSIKERSW